MADRRYHRGSTLLIGRTQAKQGEQRLALLRLLGSGFGDPGSLVGAAACMAAVAFWAGSWIAAKVALGSFAPIHLALARFSFGSIALLAILALTEPTRGFDFRRDGRWLLVAAFANAIQQGIWATGLVLTTVTNGALIGATMPIITVLMAAGLGLERFRPRQIAGIAAGFAGVGVVVGWHTAVPQAGEVFGDLLILASGVAWALATIAVAPLLRHYSPVRVNAYTMLLAMLMLLPLAAFQPIISGRPSGPAEILSVAYLVAPATVIAYLSWHAGVRRLGASRSMVFFYVQPLIALLLAAVLLGEQIQPSHILGAAIVFVGIALVQRRAAARPLKAVGSRQSATVD